MRREEHLKQKQAEYEKLYKSLTQRIQFLRDRLENNQLSPADEFKVKRQIGRDEQNREKVNLFLEKIESVLASEKLYHSLLRLGYHDQEKIFIKFIREYPVSAFLIHGEPEHGQSWLVNRLRFNQIGKVTPKKVTINLGRLSSSSDISALWRQLGKATGLGRHSTPSEVAKQISKWWTTNHVVLIFKNISFLPESYFNRLLNEFWLPLAQSIQRIGGFPKKYYLFMFFVDYEGYAGNWNVKFAEKHHPAWDSSIPVKLPIIERFSDLILIDWLEHEYVTLPADLTQNQEHSVHKILQKSKNGIPEWVMEEICDMCRCDWLEKWSEL